MFPPLWPPPGSGQAKVQIIMYHRSPYVMTNSNAELKNGKRYFFRQWESILNTVWSPYTVAFKCWFDESHWHCAALTNIRWLTDTHPACGLKHFEVQWISWQLAIYFSKRVAGGHTCHKLGLYKTVFAGIFLREVETEEAGKVGRWGQLISFSADVDTSNNCNNMGQISILLLV